MINGWNNISISQSCDILDNFRRPINQEERAKIQGEIPYYGANNIQDYINDYIFDEPLILIAEDGGYFEDFATRPIAQKITGKSWVNNHTHILRARKQYNQDFIFYALEHKNIMYFIKGGTRSKLNKSDLEEILILIPKLEKEQQKIAKILTSVDESVEATNKIITKQKRVKTALMQDLLTRGIDKDGNIRSEETHEFKDSPLGRIPKEWDCNKLYEMSIFVKDGTHSTHRDVDNGVPLLSAKDINNGKISIPKNSRKISKQDYNLLHKNFTLCNDDLLLTVVGTIGRSAIIKNLNQKITFQRSVAFIRLKKQKLASYIYQFINSHYFLKQLDELQNASAQPGVYLKQLESTDIIFPKSDKEQYRISKILSKQDEAIEQEEQKLQKLQRVKKALMQDLLTGKVRVNYE